ncbi:hypothetical protein ACFWA1_36025 [Streptomyces sp. NPDC060005]|uniref:hypothetical protein n=1 Tax=Streptomyces sp. NPDC060005 TaxID=3347034 RepID=UPI0036AE831F
MTTETTTAKTEAAAPEVEVPAAFTPAAAARRAHVERTVYAAAGAAATFGPQLGNAWMNGGAFAVGVGTLAYLWNRTRAEDGARLITSVYRALPGLGLSGTYAAALMAPGASLWEYAAPAGAAVLSAVAAPWTRSRGVRRALADLPNIPAPRAEDWPDSSPYIAGLRKLWDDSKVTGETRLGRIEQIRPDRPDFVTIVIAPPGEAVSTTLALPRTLAGIFDVPEEHVKTAPVPGRGPGYLAVRVAPTLDLEERAHPEGRLVELWETKVSAPDGVAPGVRLLQHRIEEERVILRVEASGSGLLQLPRLRLARALGVEDPELLMIETDGMAGGVITIYREHPLINVREALPSDLVMDDDGRIAVGMRHDGRPARWPLYNPELGAVTDLLVGAPGSGKSVTLLTLIAAERINGIVSIVADAQDGMSLPEAAGRVYHFGAGQAASAATLAATCAVANYRAQVSAANGWGSFVLNRPWALAFLTMDEINRMLSADSGVPEPFRKWVAGMLGAGQITFRKVGIGVRIAGQSIHLTDLGDSEKIRANAKNGTVWLGRVNSSMTRSMAADMASGTVEITPIPKYFGVTGAAELDAAWAGEETPTGPVTAGTAWQIQSGSPYLARVWKAAKANRTYPGLIELMETATITGFTPAEDEIFRARYASALIEAQELLNGNAGTVMTPKLLDELERINDATAATRTAPAPTATAGIPTAPPVPLRDQVLAVLTAELQAVKDIRRAVGVNTDGGPSAGSVDNALQDLKREGLADNPKHGKWARTDQA